MATYYVRPTGNDTNTGTGPATNQAWATIQKALGATSGVVGGDIIYVAPGHYFEQVVVGFTSPSSTVQIIGDVTASQFSGATAGIVRLSGFSSAGNAAIVYTLSILKGTSKNNLSFSNFIFEGKGTGNTGTGLVTFLTSQNISFSKCLFSQQGYDGTASTGAVLQLTAPSTLPINATISKCVFEGARLMLSLTGSNVADASSVKDCIFFSGNYQLYVISCQVTVINNTFSGCYGNACDFAAGSASFPSVFRNNLFLFNVVGISCPAAQGTEDYNRFIGTQSARASIGVGSNSTTVGSSRLTYGFLRILGLAATDFWSPEPNSPNQGFGTATGAEATDVYSTAWTGATPDAGYQTYSVSTNLAPTYYPTERNAGTITIAPGSTSQSIEVYLGVTGLTASTAGLSARYNRTRTASVNIPLVARTIGQAWISGGFAEVDAVNMPGIYRVDIPDAALAAGADDVTLVVRGAAGTNGAVMTVKLSSGGLTEAQTASAVWGATIAGYNTATDFGGVVNETRSVVGSTEAYVLDVPNQVWNELTSTHTTHGTFGWNLLRADQQSKQGLVTLHASGGINRVDADVHAIVNDTDAAIELKGALLHNGTDYISANLLTPTSPATLLRMGPYSVVADQAKQEINIDILTGSSLPVVLQLVDVTGTGIPLVGATLSVKIYNAAGTLVTTYTGTASYSDAGFLTFTLDSVVTATPGTYYLTVTRTTGATDTSIYGGLRLYVRSN